MKNILVTGASGFLGKLLCDTLLKKGHHVTGIDLQPPSAGFNSNDFQFIPLDLTAPLDSWPADLMEDIDTIFHLAARVHIMDDTAPDAMNEYRKLNTHATRQLAEQANQAGARRFIFMSTIKVNGEGRKAPYRASDAPEPMDPYAVSKWEAEQAITRIGRTGGLESVILRAPLVYGPGVKANLLKLFKIVDLGIPLPLKNVTNRRSLIYSGNLVDALIACMENPAAGGRTFLVSDGRDMSTSELLDEIAAALGKTAKMFSFPEVFLKLAGRLLGKSAWIDRLLGTLSVDSRPIQEVLNWHPPFSVSRGMRQTADWYIKDIKKDKKG